MAPPGKPLRSIPAPVFPLAGKTVRQQLERGAKFQPETGTCVACGGFGQCAGDKVDTSTGLGEACWRAWRWSSVREYEIKGT